jgi:hypothetical protein
MPEHDSRSLDVLGIKPVADAISHVTKATVDGASAFLSRICLPAAEEFGLLLQDRVRAWRAGNTVRVVAAAQAYAERYRPDQESHAHPRLVATILEHGSWSDDSTLQQLWGGLLTSSCSEDGRDDSNLIFVTLLSQLTALQVRLLAYGCEKCQKMVTPSGLIMPIPGLYVDIPTLNSIAGTADLHRIDRELDHLRGLELIQMGIHAVMQTIDLTPSALALNLYVRCQGFRGSPVEFFDLMPPVQKA